MTTSIRVKSILFVSAIQLSEKHYLHIIIKRKSRIPIHKSLILGKRHNKCHDIKYMIFHTSALVTNCWSSLCLQKVIETECQRGTVLKEERGD